MVDVYEVIRNDGSYIWVLLRTYNYEQAKELYDWFDTYMRCFSYKLRKVKV